MGGASPRQFLTAAGYNSGGVEVGFPRDVGVSGLQIVKTGKSLLVRTDSAPGLVTTSSTTNCCFPFVSVGGALPRHLLVAAGAPNTSASTASICFADICTFRSRNNL